MTNEKLQMMKKEKIYCFDFDGTLTKKDTLIEFIKFSMGKTRFLRGFLLYSPILVLMKLHFFPNWKAKQIIFKHFFGGMSIEDFDDYCVNFVAKNLYLLRLSGIGKIQEAKRKKERVLIVSASIDNWVKPFFDFQNLTDVEVLGTQIEVANGKVTGYFKTNNCYGEEKAPESAEPIISGITVARQRSSIWQSTVYLQRSLFSASAAS